MRVRALEDPHLQEFDRWTLDIGNGNMSYVKISENLMGVKIVSETKAIHDLVDIVFLNINTNIQNYKWLNGRAILAVTNQQVKAINDIAMQKVGNLTVMLESVDKCTDTSDELRFNPEFLHTLTPDGFPPHTLMLKPGIPLMLLRNLNLKHGLCNGTRLIFNSVIYNKVLSCTIVESQAVVLIPRITFVFLSDDSWPINWQRKQFPVN